MKSAYAHYRNAVTCSSGKKPINYMRISLLLIVFVMLSAFRSAAEKTSEFRFDTTQAYRYFSAYRYVQVVDNRINKENLGTVHGAFGKKVPVIAELSLEQAVSDFSYSMIRGGKYAGNDTLLVVIYNFEFEELAEDDLATFYFKAQFFRGGDNRYQLVTDADTICETHIDRKVMKQKPTLLLGGYLTAIAGSNTRIADTGHYMVAEAIEKVAMNKYFPIYNCNGNFKK